MIDPNRPTGRARKLRNEATPAERRLWKVLRNSTLDGFKFSRQIPVGPYVCDLVCRWENLVIELDGQHHDMTIEPDKARQTFIESLGYTVLRFSNAEVFGNLEGVVATIRAALPDVPTPNPSLKGGGRASS